ncbi:hypothetical protein [Paenibacillus sp. EPM92]|uniref:hypothetical protein n=1 Tax=Paenibacillus sp. EPM92 TaxID=1561195 RepID=UPI0019156AF8|nr:hypothetical protein [Paenibacillus sp. EPM92]
MARRGKPLISQFFNRDRLAFTALAKCGHVSHEHLRSCGLVDKRIQNMVRDRHFEKVVYKQNGKIKECYQLTKLGRQTASRLWQLERVYYAQSPAHDVALADKYFSLPENLRDSWKSENEVRGQFQEQLRMMHEQDQEMQAKLYEDMLIRGLISMPDCVYTNENGLEIAFEIITGNYSEEELRAKEALVEIMQYQYETTRI